MGISMLYTYYIILYTWYIICEGNTFHMMLWHSKISALYLVISSEMHKLWAGYIGMGNSLVRT